MRVLLIVTGSIACKLYEKIEEELGKGNEVKVLFTEEVKKVLNLNFLVGEKYPCENTVLSEWELYEEQKKVKHIELAKWAEKILIAPCTANTLNKLSNGICDNIVMGVLTAYIGMEKPLYIALSMNTFMYKNFTVQDSIKKLKDRGVIFTTPTVKKLACGELGIGALADIGTIVKIVNGVRWGKPLKSIENYGEYIPRFTEAGSFGYQRKHEIHNGVDLYCKDGEEVFAVEDGEVIKTGQFTGKDLGSTWWKDTWYILIRGESGVVCYGEMEETFNYKVGELVKRGDFIGKIKAVLPDEKKRKDIRNHNNAMLHLQFFKGYESEEQLKDWYPDIEREKLLLDPTPYLELIK